jgi:hypothetical protein
MSLPLYTVLNQMNPIQILRPVSLRFISTISLHLCLGLPNGIFYSGFPTNCLGLCTFLISLIPAIRPDNLILLDFIALTIFA